MKIAIITDTHFGVRGDNAVIFKHHKRFYDEVFFPKIDELGIKTIIHGGDVTDRRKYINFQTAQNLHETFIKKIADRDIDLHVILGNHDCFYKNTNSVNSMRQLYGSSNIEKLHVYYDEPTEVQFDNLSILLTPWINAENQENSLKAITESKARVMVGHLSVEGFEMNRGAFCDHGFNRKTFGHFDYVFSGHFHHPSNQGNIYYLGAPYEMRWDDYDGRRGFHIFDTATGELEFIENPFRIFNKVFYSDEELTAEGIGAMDLSSLEDTYLKIIVQTKNNPYLFDLFLDQVQKYNPADVKVVDDHLGYNEISEEDLVDEAEDTKTTIKKYIDAIETDVAKEPLSDYMFELLHKAQDM